MGHTLTYANKMNLAAMVPRNDLASTKYCLANPGTEYLVYLPSPNPTDSWFGRIKEIFIGNHPTVTVNLSTVRGVLKVEWFNPTTGVTTNGETVTGGARRAFTAPFDGDAVLYLASIENKH